jgi:CubicO group peptidase (beta-lactamase class C family)
MRLFLVPPALLLGLLADPALAQNSAQINSRVDSVFSRYDSTHSPGCALGVVQGDQLVYKRGYGMSNLEHGVPITPQSIFHVASISKQFAATSVILLAQDGKLSLDDEVRKHIAELPDFGKRITIRHLIHHTSGLRDQWSLLALGGWRPDDPKTEKDIMELIVRQKELNFAPGEEHLYSNTGYTLLAVIVKRVTGKTLREFADERIFRPLGMNNTHFHDDHSMIVPNRTSAYVQRGSGYAISIPVFDNHGATSLFTTVEDMAKWNRNFDNPVVGGRGLLDELYHQGVLNDGEVLTYAGGVVKGTYNSLQTVGHGGADAGYRADFLRFPETGYAFITLCNFGSINPGELNRQVAAVYLGDRMKRTAPPERPQPAQVTAAELQEYVGIYFNARMEALRRASIRDGKLVWGATGGVEMIPLGRGEFRIVGQPVTVAFRKQGKEVVLEERIDNTKPLLFQRVNENPPTINLAQYEGVYYSPELDVEWKVANKNGRLVIERRRFEDMPLQPLFVDAFQGQGFVRFTRNTSGRIDGFRLGVGRVRNLRFEKRS